MGHQHRSSRTRYYGVQALRGFAAIGVVGYHMTLAIGKQLGGEPGWLFTAGGAGVDLFFAISGFVIVITSASSWGNEGVWATFLKRRLMRVVPLYWIMTFTLLVMFLCDPRNGRHSRLTLGHTIASFLFIPARDSHHQTLPLIPAGWTLSFEMLFYLLFTLVLALRLRPVVSLTAVFIVLSLIGLLRTDDWGAPASLIDPVLMEFVFGMWIGIATLRGLRLSVSSSVSVSAVVLLLLAATCGLPEAVCWYYRVIIWGVPTALLLMSAIALKPRLPSFVTGWPRLLGDASYAIYLSHGFVTSAVDHVFRAPSAGYLIPAPLVFTAAMLGAAGDGIAVHRITEQPLAVWLGSFKDELQHLRSG
jgi:exopolysaccharide production protein ExoZ